MIVYHLPSFFESEYTGQAPLGIFFTLYDLVLPASYPPVSGLEDFDGPASANPREERVTGRDGMGGRCESVFSRATTRLRRVGILLALSRSSEAVLDDIADVARSTW